MISPALVGAGVFTGLKNCVWMFASSFVAYIIIGPIWICRGVNHPFTPDAFNMGCSDGGLMSTFTEGPTVIYLQKVASPGMVALFSKSDDHCWSQWWLWVAIGLLFSDQIVGISLQCVRLSAPLVGVHHED